MAQVVPPQHACLLRLLAGLACAAAVVSCGGGGGNAPEGPVTVYSTDFDAADTGQWLQYTENNREEGCADLAHVSGNDGSRYAVSQAPWWTDENHIEPGLGYLHLVAFAYHRDWSTDGVIPAESPGQRPLDLRDAEITLRWRAPSLQLPPEATLLFWFQTRTSALGVTPGRYANYVLTGQPLRYLVASGGWQEDTLRLQSIASQYACMGSSPERADVYGCDLDAVEALRNWNVDLGFVILFRDPSAAQQISGAVEFDHLSMRLPADNLDTHRDAAPSIARANNSTC